MTVVSAEGRCIALGGRERQYGVRCRLPLRSNADVRDQVQDQDKEKVPRAARSERSGAERGTRVAGLAVEARIRLVGVIVLCGCHRRRHKPDPVWSPPAYFAYVALLRDFRARYRDALEGWRAGMRDVLFPFGCFSAKTFAGRCVKQAASRNAAPRPTRGRPALSLTLQRALRE
jgi:hypothetical protein